MVVTKEEVSSKGQLATSCMLDNSLYTVLSVGAGLAIFFRTKTKRHFVIAISVGTFADIVVGYYGTCKPQRLDYELAKADYELIYPPPPKKPSMFPKIFKVRNFDEMTTDRENSEARKKP